TGDGRAFRRARRTLVYGRLQVCLQARTRRRRRDDLCVGVVEVAGRYQAAVTEPLGQRLLEGRLREQRLDDRGLKQVLVADVLVGVGGRHELGAVEGDDVLLGVDQAA